MSARFVLVTFGLVCTFTVFTAAQGANVNSDYLKAVVDGKETIIFSITEAPKEGVEKLATSSLNPAPMKNCVMMNDNDGTLSDVIVSDGTVLYFVSDGYPSLQFWLMVCKLANNNPPVEAEGKDVDISQYFGYPKGALFAFSDDPKTDDESRS